MEVTKHIFILIFSFEDECEMDSFVKLKLSEHCEIITANDLYQSLILSGKYMKLIAFSHSIDILQRPGFLDNLEVTYSHNPHVSINIAQNQFILISLYSKRGDLITTTDLGYEFKV
jgi:hypothetical protein